MKRCRPVVKEPSGGTLLFRFTLPARGASKAATILKKSKVFASTLPARGASAFMRYLYISPTLCLGAACTGCITSGGIFACRGRSLPRRCLHGVHRQKPTNCGTPFCSIRRESVDSFSEINNKDSCADYFPVLFCCQGDLYRHYRQPRTGNRPVLRCEQHRLFLFILSSHYRRLL